MHGLEGAPAAAPVPPAERTLELPEPEPEPAAKPAAAAPAPGPDLELQLDEFGRPRGIRYFDRALAPLDVEADDVDRLFDAIALLLMPVDRRHAGQVKDLHH